MSGDVWLSSFSVWAIEEKDVQNRDDGCVTFHGKADGTVLVVTGIEGYEKHVTMTSLEGAKNWFETLIAGKKFALEIDSDADIRDFY